MLLSEDELDTLARGYGLSPRERQIVSLLFEGVIRTQEMACRMELSVNTVKVYLRHVYMKTRSPDKATVMFNCLSSLRVYKEAGDASSERR